MARILVTPAMFTGHLFPHLAVAAEIGSRGHDVAVYSDQRSASFIRQAGCRFIATTSPDLSSAFATMATNEEVSAAFEAVARAVAPHLMSVLRDERFDAIVTDTFHLGAGLAAAATRCAWVSLATSPFESDAEFQTSSLRSLETATLRRELGLPPTSQDAYQQALSPKLTLLPWSDEFDGGELAAPSQRIGPLAWDPPDQDASPSGGQPPAILVTTSTSAVESVRQDVVAYLEATIEALSQIEVPTLITAGDYWPQDRRTPEHVKVVPFASHAAAMRTTKLVITHGGWGSISRALVHGVPMIVVPFAIDQPRNAERAEQTGVGVYLPPELLAPETLYNTVTELLVDDAPQRVRARDIAVGLRARPAAAVAADLVLAQLAGAS